MLPAPAFPANTTRSLPVTQPSIIESSRLAVELPRSPPIIETSPPKRQASKPIRIAVAIGAIGLLITIVVFASLRSVDNSAEAVASVAAAIEADASTAPPKLATTPAQDAAQTLPAVAAGIPDVSLSDAQPTNETVVSAAIPEARFDASVPTPPPPAVTTKVLAPKTEQPNVAAVVSPPTPAPQFEKADVTAKWQQAMKEYTIYAQHNGQRFANAQAILADYLLYVPPNKYDTAIAKIAIFRKQLKQPSNPTKVIKANQPKQPPPIDCEKEPLKCPF